MSKELEIESLQKQAQLLIQLISRLKEALILETDVTVQFRQEKQIVEKEAALVVVRNQLDQLLQKEITPVAPTIKFQTHHQNTCNRTEQAQTFIQYVYKEAPADKKIHFFYLHGGDLQEHAGLYKRFVHKLAGRDLDYKDNYEASNIQVLDCGSIDFPNYTEADALKIGVSRELMKTVGIEDYQMEKVMDKNLKFVYQESPKLQNLHTHDKVCFFISIPETRWNAQLTPTVTKWFIKEFCQPTLPATAPSFYFFFSVEYDEDNSQIKKELRVALEEAEETINLSELSMVKKTDVADWFNIYDVFWERKSEQKKVFKKYFAEEEEELYMDDVQFSLKKIINEINNSEKDAHRNS